MYLGDVMTVGVNLAGFPAVSVPAGMSLGLPVGVQIIGAPFEEGAILNVAHHLERSLGLNLLPPL